MAEAAMATGVVYAKVPAQASSAVMPAAAGAQGWPRCISLAAAAVLAIATCLHIDVMGAGMRSRSVWQQGPVVMCSSRTALDRGCGSGSGSDSGSDSNSADATRLLVLSFGGVATTFFMNKLQSSNSSVVVNARDDSDGLKHSMASAEEAQQRVRCFAPDKVLYLFGHPAAAAHSLFRRNYTALQYCKLHGLPLSQNASVERSLSPLLTHESEYARAVAEVQMDWLGMEQHMMDWMAVGASVPIMFTDVDGLYADPGRIANFIGVPHVTLAFLKGRPRPRDFDPKGYPDDYIRFYNGVWQRMQTFRYLVRHPQHAVPVPPQQHLRHSGGVSAASAVAPHARRDGPRPQILLCVPENGLNDVLNQVAHCTRYAQLKNRSLVLRWDLTAFREPLSKYFDMHLPVQWEDYHPNMAEQWRHLTVFPAVLQGRLHTYFSTLDRFVGHVDALTGTHLGANFHRKYREDIVVHHGGGGGHPSFLLPMLRLRPHMVRALRVRLAALPPRFLAVHARNTDIASNISALLPRLRKQKQPFFFATDSNVTLSQVSGELGSTVVSFSLIPPTDATHINIHEAVMPGLPVQRRNMDAILDLFTLACGGALLLAQPESGYARLAANLHSHSALLANITSACG